MSLTKKIVKEKVHTVLGGLILVSFHFEGCLVYCINVWSYPRLLHVCSEGY